MDYIISNYQFMLYPNISKAMKSRNILCEGHVGRNRKIRNSVKTFTRTTEIKDVLEEENVANSLILKCISKKQLVRA